MAEAHRINQHDAPAPEPDTRHIDLLQQILDVLAPIAEHARLVLSERKQAENKPNPNPSTEIVGD